VGGPYDLFHSRADLTLVGAWETGNLLRCDRAAFSRKPEGRKCVFTVRKHGAECEKATLAFREEGSPCEKYLVVIALIASLYPAGDDRTSSANGQERKMGLRGNKQAKRSSRNTVETPVVVRAVQTQTPGRAFVGIFALCACVIGGAVITLLAQPNEGGMPFWPVSAAEANTVPQSEIAGTMPPTLVPAAESNDPFSVAALTEAVNARIAGSLPPLIRDAFVPRPADPLAAKRGPRPSFAMDVAPVAAPAVMPTAVAQTETTEAMGPAVATPITTVPVAL
jgi:hypothetical protein